LGELYAAYASAPCLPVAHSTSKTAIFKRHRGFKSLFISSSAQHISLIFFSSIHKQDGEKEKKMRMKKEKK
jgi:hypothetical protein